MRRRGQNRGGPNRGYNRKVIPHTSEPGFGENMWSNLTPDTPKNIDAYFESYSHFSVHEGMLKDDVRTNTYKNAMIKNPELFAGKTVLDIGCGTGVLSIFAAKAGAARVFGIDEADIAYSAQQIVKLNNLDDKITIIKGKVEDIELPVNQVDIIISEWMGYLLLYESMLDTVLYARDKWLHPNGLLFPDKAAIYVAGIEDTYYFENKIEFWDDVYGINMATIKNRAFMEPIVDTVDPKTIVTTECCIYECDIKTVTVEELDFVSTYSIKANRKDYVHALVGWFDVFFTHGNVKFTLSCNPKQRSTHWSQMIFYLRKTIPIHFQEEIHGSFAIKKNKDEKRDIDVKVSYHYEGANWQSHDINQYLIR